MVHLRLNEKETNPNPHINFITVVQTSGEERARELLRALAAQVKPVMRAHGFTINSFEEVCHNFMILLNTTTRLGRVIIHHALVEPVSYIFNVHSSSMNGTPCSRAGTGTRGRQLVSCSHSYAGKAAWITHPVLAELVLRRREGSFLPVSYLLDTFCHEVCSDRSCIGLLSQLFPRRFDYAFSFPILNPLMTPLSVTPLTRPGPDSHTQILIIDCTNLYLIHVQLTNSFPFHFTNSWRTLNT
jgi:hypothetical protein